MSMLWKPIFFDEFSSEMIMKINTLECEFQCLHSTEISTDLLTTEEDEDQHIRIPIGIIAAYFHIQQINRLRAHSN